MDLLPRLGISLLFFLAGAAFIIWATRISVFSGLLGLIEEFLPEGFRSILRRIANSLVGLAMIAISLAIFFLAGKKP